MIDLQETFRAFFTHKIDTIRNNLDVVFVVVVVVFSIQSFDQKGNENSFTEPVLACSGRGLMQIVISKGVQVCFSKR